MPFSTDPIARYRVKLSSTYTYVSDNQLAHEAGFTRVVTAQEAAGFERQYQATMTDRGFAGGARCFKREEIDTGIRCRTVATIHRVA